jgi:hypothetical protein
MLSLNRINVLTILGFTFLATAVIMMFASGPASTYEISIYSAYPTFFWLLFIAGFICGVTILVIAANDEKNTKNKPIWINGFILLIATNLIFFSIPIFRGYFTYGRDDVLTVIGYAKDVLNNGYIGIPGSRGEDYYPAIHILLAYASNATQISPEKLVQVFLPFFVSFYMFSIYLLSKYN